MRECGWCQGFWTNERGRERKMLQRKRRKTLFPYLYASTEEEDTQCCSKTTLFWVFFIWTVNETTGFVQNAPFHLNKNGAKKCLFPNQFSVFNLFNQVHNCNFDFKNRFNCILVKFKCQPWSWPPFSLWSLVLNICILALNWSTNF
jgi:hypothetical protein